MITCAFWLLLLKLRGQIQMQSARLSDDDADDFPTKNAISVLLLLG